MGLNLVVKRMCSHNPALLLVRLGEDIPVLSSQIRGSYACGHLQLDRLILYSTAHIYYEIILQAFDVEAFPVRHPTGLYNG